MKYCNWCKEKEIPNYQTYCSKSCATSYRNDKAVREGTHNLLSSNGGSKMATENNYKRVADGTHPFFNMSEESRILAGIGISKARLEESRLGTHPWQQSNSWINNEFSRSLSIIKRDNLQTLSLYYSDCSLDGHFKIGWSRDVDYREIDNRTHQLSNVVELRSGDALFIITLEKDLKWKFFDEERSNRIKSTEIFPNHLKNDILNYVLNY